MTEILQSNMLGRAYQKSDNGSDIHYFEERLSKRKEKEREELKMNQFLHDSLRSSDRLRALEKSKKLNYKMNAAFEDDEIYADSLPADFDITRFTEALCKRKPNKGSTSKAELEWLKRCMQDDAFQTAFVSSVAIPEILTRYEHPPLAGRAVAQRKLQKVTALLSAAHGQSRESHYKYQMKELLQILSGPDLQALCHANDQCAGLAAAQRDAWSSASRELSPEDPASACPSPRPRGIPSGVPSEPQAKSVPSGSRNSVRIIKSPLAGCYAQIHASDRDIPIKTVFLEKGKNPLGATVRNERDAVVIGRIVMGGVAYKSGLLKEGDELLSINDLELTGKDVNEVSDIFARLSGTLRFTVASINDGITGSIARPLSSSTIHLKALFSYKPDDDAYMPCIDIGLAFERRDVLHVTNVQDPNWWQAYRDDDGRDSSSLAGLAGLIPSPDYQYQRERLRKQLNGNEQMFNIYASTRHQSSMLCLKKNKRNNLALNNGGWVYNVDSNSRQSTVEIKKHKSNKKRKGTYCPADLELNDIDPSINTYEEVQMFIPQPHRKRPIVLVGPELIGKHDLVNMIISSDPDQFSSVIQHTTLDSKLPQYRNVSKDEFRHLQNQDEFIETATFEKNWYGLSKTEVKSIIDSGKTAVFVLQPESLQVIRRTNFLPYVIFISPPTNIELLRKLRMQLEQQRPPDDELITTMDRASAIDMMFGQFFDTVLVVSSLPSAREIALKVIRSLDRDPQWIPSRWLGHRPMSHVSHAQ